MAINPVGGWLGRSGGAVPINRVEVPGPVSQGGAGRGGAMGLVKNGLDIYTGFKNAESNRKVAEGNLLNQKQSQLSNITTNIREMGGNFVPIPGYGGDEHEQRANFHARLTEAHREAWLNAGGTEEGLRNMVQTSTQAKTGDQLNAYARGGRSVALTQVGDMAEQGALVNSQVDRPEGEPASTVPLTDTVGQEISGAEEIRTQDAVNTQMKAEAQNISAEGDVAASQVPPTPGAPTVDPTAFEIAAGEPVDPYDLEDTAYAAEQRYNNAVPQLRTQPDPNLQKEYFKANRAINAYNSILDTRPDSGPAYQAVANMTNKQLGNLIELQQKTTYKIWPERLRHYQNPDTLIKIGIASVMRKDPALRKYHVESLMDFAKSTGKNNPQAYVDGIMEEYDKSWAEAVDTAWPFIAPEVAAVEAQITERVVKNQDYGVKLMEQYNKKAEVKATIHRSKIMERNNQRDNATNREGNLIKAGQLSVNQALASQAERRLGLDFDKYSQDQIKYLAEQENQAADNLVALLTDNVLTGLSEDPSGLKDLTRLGMVWDVLQKQATLSETIHQPWGAEKKHMPEVAEMYRLYVDSDYKGNNVGESEAQAIDKRMTEIMFGALDPTGNRKPMRLDITGPDGKPILDKDGKPMEFDPTKPKYFMDNYFNLLEQLKADKARYKQMKEAGEKALYYPNKKAEVLDRLVSLSQQRGIPLSSKEFRQVADSDLPVAMDDFIGYKQKYGNLA